MAQLFSLLLNLASRFMFFRFMGWMDWDDISGLVRRYGFYAVVLIVAVGTWESAVIILDGKA